MELFGYFDESGTHDETGAQDGADVAAVVGWVSTKDDWDAFDDAWRAALHEFNVRAFHFSEFSNTKHGPRHEDWPYLGWSDAKRNQFIETLIPIARDHSTFGIGGAMCVPDYHALVPASLRRHVVHPYHFCFQLLFDELTSLLENGHLPDLLPGEKIALFFSDQRESKSLTEAAFAELKVRRSVEDRIGSLTFASPNDYSSLQAADLLAYIVRNHKSRENRGKPAGGVMTAWHASLIERQNVLVGYYDKSNLPSLIEDLRRRGAHPDL